MQPKDYLKNQARKLAKQTWAGPGKFGVFIIICIFIIAAFESLGLSNREKNLEIRTVSKVVISQAHSQVIEVKENNTEMFNEKLKLSAQFDYEKKILQRENILLFGALDQYMYENSVNNLMDGIGDSDKTKLLLSMVLNSQEAIMNEEIMFDI
jgi:hypothetical protein